MISSKTDLAEKLQIAPQDLFECPRRAPTLLLSFALLKGSFGKLQQRRGNRVHNCLHLQERGARADLASEQKKARLKAGLFVH
jgi:hypothetical protein